MANLNVCVIIGGMSTEHDVSMISGKNVVENLDKDKYEVYPVVIDKNGKWYEQSINNNEEKKEIENIVEYLKKKDIVFPVLHGLYGEDGTIQGMLELLKIPYVGCGILSSSICMDKVYSKVIFQKAKILQAKYIYIKNKNTYIDEEFNEREFNSEEIIETVEKKLGFPVFVKPSNSGSSVGINKVKDAEELIKAIDEAAVYDKKILIEKAIVGKEVECAVLGNEEVKASIVGQILPAEDFYTYDAKYNNPESLVKIPADLSEQKINEIRELAIKAFKAVDGSGLARVDFFVEDGTEKVYINEINTMPGFTEISMYPKLWGYEGLKYSELLSKLIELAINK